VAAFTLREKIARTMRTIALTASMVRTYKSCPRKYELEYIEMLKPAITPEALATGSSYHACVEKILKGEPYQAEGVVEKMAAAFDRFIPWREWGIKEVEKEFDVHVGYGFHMRGKIDAILDDGTPVEHKTYKNTIDEKYIDNLAWDDQVSYYLLALSRLRGEPITRVTYTVCQKPTIRQTQKETYEDYLQRIEGWYDETKVRTFQVVRSPEELKEIEADTRELAKEIRRRKHFYRNPSNCSILGCEYRSICLNYDPQMLMGFVKKGRKSEELCKF
jgi:hypothetical protein